MDTIEARRAVAALARRSLELLSTWKSEDVGSVLVPEQLHAVIGQARSLLADAGYPAETVWQALRAIQLGLDAYDEPPQSEYWTDVEADLRSALDSLEALVSPGARDADFHFIG